MVHATWVYHNACCSLQKLAGAGAALSAAGAGAEGSSFLEAIRAECAAAEAAETAPDSGLEQQESHATAEPSQQTKMPSSPFTGEPPSWLMRLLRARPQDAAPADTAGGLLPKQSDSGTSADAEPAKALRPHFLAAGPLKSLQAMLQKMAIYGLTLSAADAQAQLTPEKFQKGIEILGVCMPFA